MSEPSDGEDEQSEAASEEFDYDDEDGADDEDDAMDDDDDDDDYDFGSKKKSTKIKIPRLPKEAAAPKKKRTSHLPAPPCQWPETNAKQPDHSPSAEKSQSRQTKTMQQEHTRRNHMSKARRALEELPTVGSQTHKECGEEARQRKSSHMTRPRRITVWRVRTRKDTMGPQVRM